jgi:predicted 3-demethylubiquinone-9 3-methyltransferase (glyoxalase superfamily)
MFTGQAEEAMSLYVSLFPGSKISSIERYGEDQAGRAGTVKQAAFELSGTRYLCIDSPAVHAFTFTPAISLFVDCDSREQLDQAFERLSAGGQVFMPPDNYGFSSWYTWVQDQYGVAWQLNLP